MKIAISPCPNDTYLFHAWVKGIVAPPPQVTFADIEELNQLAHTGEYPLIKLSFNCFRQITSLYQLLPIGSALGFHCGPKIIAKEPFLLHKLPEKRIAIPGKETTAHLLLERLLPSVGAKHFCLYHEVADLIESGAVDCGLIIHETRFTFAARGLSEIVDLGEVWHAKFDLPLPLGGLAILRSFPQKEELLQILQDSLSYARSHPKAAQSFVLEHSQEIEEEVVERHIAAYVNRETEALTETGIKAIETLTGLCLDDSLFLPQKQRQTPLCSS